MPYKGVDTIEEKKKEILFDIKKMMYGFAFFYKKLMQF